MMISSQLKSICILRLSAIGDVCHTVAVIQRLQREYPAAAITWIIGKVEASLVGDLPGIEFIVFDKRQGIQAYYSLYQTLRNRSFDVLLHMQVAFRASLISLFITAPYRIGFDRERARDFQWCFTNIKIPSLPRQHVLVGLMQFLNCVSPQQTSEIEPITWQINLGYEEQAWVEQQIDATKRLLIINPSASNPVRNWLTERYIAVADYALKQNIQVILTGGNAAHEVALGEKIFEALSGKIHNLIGKTHLKQLLALLARADVLLAPDTGPVHMATMVNTPVIGLYACSNPLRTGPYYSLYIINRYPQAIAQFLGKTEQQVPWGKRINNTGAMALITVEDVLYQFNRVMQLKC